MLLLYYRPFSATVCNHTLSTITATCVDCNSLDKTFTDVYGNYIAVNQEWKYAEAELFHGDIIRADAKRFRYIPDDYESYKITVHTLRGDDFETMLSWPTTARIVIVVPRKQGRKMMKRVEELQKSHKLQLCVLPKQFERTDPTKKRTACGGCFIYLLLKPFLKPFQE